MSIPAGIIGNPQLAAVIALVYMSPQFSRSAYLDGPHDPEVTKGHFRTMKLPIIRSKTPKNIGDL
jgi:hypothetical protein